LSYSNKKSQLQDEKEARQSKTPEKETRRKHQGEREKIMLICLRMCVQEASVRNRKPEAERASQNQECQENKGKGKGYTAISASEGS
jgi:hypothetical protein